MLQLLAHSPSSNNGRSWDKPKPEVSSGSPAWVQDLKGLGILNCFSGSEAGSWLGLEHLGKEWALKQDPDTSKARTLATRIPCEASKDIFKAQHTQRKIGKWGFTETKSLCIANENKEWRHGQDKMFASYIYEKKISRVHEELKYLKSKERNNSVRKSSVDLVRHFSKEGIYSINT